MVTVKRYRSLTQRNLLHDAPIDKVAMAEQQKVLQRQGPRVEIALNFINADAQHRLQLIVVLHPFRHHPHTELMREAEDRLDEQGLTGQS